MTERPNPGMSEHAKKVHRNAFGKPPIIDFLRNWINFR